MKILPLWLVLVLLLALGAGCNLLSTKGSNDLLADVQARGILRIGVKYDSPPFGYLDADGKLKGMEIALARKLAEKILGDSAAVQFVQVNSSTRVAALNARQVDMVLATMTITSSRAKVVDFTEPYYHAAQAMLVRADSPYQRIADLKNKAINFVIGSTGEANLRRLLPKAKLQGFKSSTEAFSAFYAGRADGFSTDDAILYGFLHEYCGLRVLDERVSEEPYGIAFRKEEASQPLKKAVEAVLRDMQASGAMKALVDEWHQVSPPSDCPEKAAS